MAFRHFAAFLASLLVALGASACSGEGASGGSGSDATVVDSGAEAPLPDTFVASAGASIPEPATPLFQRVDSLARSLAASSFTPPASSLPPAMEGMTYDQYRSIRFRPERAIWRDRGAFEVQFFHTGYQYPAAVAIHLVEDEGAGIEDGVLAFEADRFAYEGEASGLAAPAEEASPAPGYAGFRVHYPMNRADSKDEVAVFLGASYFRLLGPGHVHGLSSRGLAVDAGLPTGEEFPDFRRFWLVRPASADTTLVLYALLDGPSVTGAYRMELTPGRAAVAGEAREAPGESVSDGARHTVVDVDARLYARRDVGKLGVAPLTSMFLFDENGGAAFDDIRPRVHDSHGLLAHTGRDEWIWRPLSNGPGLSVTSLQDVDPRGFGLVQRVRDFERYLDLEARYDRRPSEWVEVGDGHWGAGGVELMEIPSESEFNDNVVAYWTPREPFRAGERRRYQYRLITFDRRLSDQTLGQVERTRIGRAGLPGESEAAPESLRRFVVDFVGGPLESREPSEAVGVEVAASDESSVAAPIPTAVVSTLSGEISGQRVEPLPGGGWRVTFDLSTDGTNPADMRLFLEREGRPITETWSYVWDPDRIP